MNEALFLKALASINGCNIVDNQITLLDSSNQPCFVNATNYSYAYIDGHNLYFTDSDKWNRVAYTIPIISSVEDYINNQETTAISITTMTGELKYFYKSRHYAKKYHKQINMLLILLLIYQTIHYLVTTNHLLFLMIN